MSIYIKPAKKPQNHILCLFYHYLINNSRKFDKYFVEISSFFEYLHSVNNFGFFEKFLVKAVFSWYTFVKYKEKGEFNA